VIVIILSLEGIFGNYDLSQYQTNLQDLEEDLEPADEESISPGPITLRKLFGSQPKGLNGQAKKAKIELVQLKAGGKKRLAEQTKKAKPVAARQVSLQKRSSSCSSKTKESDAKKVKKTACASATVPQINEPASINAKKCTAARAARQMKGVRQSSTATKRTVGPST
jgi:hypothetical protein